MGGKGGVSLGFGGGLGVEVRRGGGRLWEVGVRIGLMGLGIRGDGLSF